MLSETGVIKKSFLEKTDPRIKLVLLIFLSVVFFLPVFYLKYIILALGIFITGCFAAGFKNMLTPLRAILPLLIMISLLTPPFHSDGIIYFTIFNYPVLTDSGIREVVKLIGRFSGITLLFYLFLKTTKIEDLTLSLRFFGLPYRGAIIISLTVRYLPYITSLYENTKDAHKMRLTAESKPVSGWNFLRRFKNMLSILSSVLIQSVKSIPNLAMSLETRGIGRKNRPGKMKQMTLLKKLTRQIILSFFVISIILCYLWL